MKNFYSQKRVLVTGAAGFIGSHICEELVNKGALVTALIRSKSNMSNLSDIRTGLIIKEVDLTNKKSLSALVKNHNIIIHAAAVDGGAIFKRQHADKIFHDNVHMTMNILESLKKSNVEKFVFISTAEVYGNLKNKDKINEEQFSLFPPQKPEHWYAFSKAIGEYTTLLIGNTLNIKVIIVRPANIYGVRDNVNKKRLVPTLLHSIKKNRKKLVLNGTGNDIRSFLHIDDYVLNLLGLIEKSDGGIYNFAGIRSIRIKDFVKLFAEQSGTKIQFKNKVSDMNNGERFILSISKAKSLVSIWHDSPYKKRVKEMINQL